MSVCHAIRAFLVGVALLGTQAQAANLLFNGDFAGSIAGWTLSGGGTAAFTPLDAAGNPQSGSLGMNITTTSSLQVCEGAAQCVPVSGGKKYSLSGQALSQSLFTGLNQGARATMFVGYFDGAGCTGNLVGGPIAVTPDNLLLPNNTWNGGATGFASAPASAMSAQVVLSACVASLGGETPVTLATWFDNVAFGPALSSAAVPTLDAWGIAALGLALAGAALLVMGANPWARSRRKG